MAVVYELEDYNFYVLEDSSKYFKSDNKIRIQLDAIMKKLFTMKKD